MDIINVLTVDVEEYFQVEAFSKYIQKEDWENFAFRVDEPTIRLLDILDSHGVTGTFFVLGWLAERNPDLVKKIFDAGHEIASHGYEHTMVTKMTLEEFRKDIRKSKQILENITKSSIQGYRAPTFSIVEKTSWAYDILLEEGFHYSSSVFPAWHDRYGWPKFGNAPRKMAVGNHGGIWEFPLPVWSLGPLRIPFGGGGYLRSYPRFLTTTFLRSLTRKGEPAIVYIHPWELDSDQPKIRVPFSRRLRHNLGISTMENKLKHLLQILKFGTMAQLLKSTV